MLSPIHKDGYTVILKLEKGTAIIDPKGRLFTDTECSRCGKRKNRKRIFEGFEEVRAELSEHRQAIARAGIVRFWLVRRNDVAPYLIDE